MLGEVANQCARTLHLELVRETRAHHRAGGLNKSFAKSLGPEGMQDVRSQVRKKKGNERRPVV